MCTLGLLKRGVRDYRSIAAQSVFVKSNLWFFTIRKSYDNVAFVTLANLRLIRDVAHHHSVSKAAHLNGITQSAASQRIRELETQLGLELFDHSRRPLAVTPAGRLYLDYCRDMLRRHDELETALRGLTKDGSGTVRLAAIYSVGLSEVSEIEARFG